MPNRGIPLPSAAAPSWVTLWPVACGEPCNDGLAFSKNSRNKRAKPRAITPIATGRWPSRRTHLDGVRNAAQKSQSVHSQPSLSVYQRAVSYRLSLLLLCCTAASSALTAPDRVEGIEPVTEETIGLLLWQGDHQRHVRPSTYHDSASAMSCSPSFSHQPRAAWRIRAPHHLLFPYGAMSVPCLSRALCETGPCPCLGTVRPSPRPRCRNHHSGLQEIISLGSGLRARHPLVQAVHVIMTKLQARRSRPPLSLPARAQRCFSMDRLTSDSLATCCVPRRRTRTALHCRYKAQRRASVPILWHGLRRFHSCRRGCLAGLVRLILTQAGPNFKYLLSSSDMPSPSGRKPSQGPRALGRSIGPNRSSPMPSIVMNPRGHQTA